MGVSLDQIRQLSGTVGKQLVPHPTVPGSGSHLGSETKQAHKINIGLAFR